MTKRAAASELEYAVARLPRDLAADARRAKEEAARPTREDLRMLRLERTRRAKTLRKLFDKLAIPVRQRPIADVYHPATLRPFSPGGGPIEWTRRPSVAWTWAPPKVEVEAPPLTPAEREERAARAGGAARGHRAHDLADGEAAAANAATRAGEPYPDDFRPPPEAQAPAPAPEPQGARAARGTPCGRRRRLVPEPPAKSRGAGHRARASAAAVADAVGAAGQRGGAVVRPAVRRRRPGRRRRRRTRTPPTFWRPSRSPPRRRRRRPSPNRSRPRRSRRLNRRSTAAAPPSHPLRDVLGRLRGLGAGLCAGLRGSDASGLQPESSAGAPELGGAVAAGARARS